jgi:tetratricopeptide (TPR) repeat protein
LASVARDAVASRGEILAGAAPGDAAMQGCDVYTRTRCGRRAHACAMRGIAALRRQALGVLAALAIPFLLGAARAGPIEDCNQLSDWRRQLRGCSTYIKQAKGESENLATAYLNRANIYARRRDYRRAFPDYAAAIARDPQNVLLFYNRGNAYFDTKQFTRAVADYSRAIALDDSFSLAYLNRGLAYERQGDVEAAVADYRRALVLDPKAIVAQRRLQRLRSQ